MALQSGFNLPASDMAQILEKNDKTAQGIRTWRSLFGNASLANASAMDKLTTSYSDAIAQAYRANLEQENQIMGAGLSSGATKSLLALSRDELQQTYDNYLANYSSALGDVASAYNEEVGAISAALGDRAQNLSDLYDSVYNYLSEELASANYTDPEGNVHDYLTEHRLDWLRDTNDPTKLNTWNMIASEMFDPETGDITVDGKNFFNQMFNALPQGYEIMDEDGNVRAARSFDEWLNDVNPELREWYAGEDPFNYTFAGTNKGTAQTLLGLESTENRPITPEQIDLNSAADVIKDSSEIFAPEIDRMLNEYSNNYKKKVELAIFEGQDESELKEMWVNDVNNYRNYVKDLINDRLDAMKNAIGDSAYNSLIEENKELYDELMTSIDNMLNKDYSENWSMGFTNEFGDYANYDNIFSMVIDILFNELPDKDKFKDKWGGRFSESDQLSKDIRDIKDKYQKFISIFSEGDIYKHVVADKYSQDLSGF